MIKFIDKRTNTLKEAFKIDKRNNKIYIQFTENGKEYGFSESNIEILEQENIKEMLVYSMNRVCYKCKKETEILTYIKFDDGTNEDITFPWDKKRLHKNNSHENQMAHLQNPDIEYYPIKTIGSDRALDMTMLKMFPKRIRNEYSNVQKRMYPMNICQHCSAKQGQYFIYEYLNKIILKMVELTIRRK